MKASDEIEAVIVLLHGFPVYHRADVIPEGEVPGVVEPKGSSCVLRDHWSCS